MKARIIYFSKITNHIRNKLVSNKIDTVRDYSHKLDFNNLFSRIFLLFNVFQDVTKFKIKYYLYKYRDCIRYSLLEAYIYCDCQRTT